MDKTGKNSVLIVDDEISNIVALSDILSQEYTVYGEKNGRDAMKTAKMYLPDVILLDILMPEMDGYEVLSLLKSEETTCETPVIFITGLVSSEDEEKGLDLGAADYIAKPFSPAIVKLRVRSQIQIVNQMRTIKRLSFIDTLTEIPNRRSFNDRIAIEWKRAAREKTPISILMIDIDRFKEYNDAYGHLQGDIGLREVAKTFMNLLKRASDFVARLGGEEFAVILANTDIDGAMNVAEQLRINIENMALPITNGKLTNLTISSGAYSVIPTYNSSIDEFISRADAALYLAKELGRNRSCRYGG